MLLISRNVRNSLDLHGVKIQTCVTESVDIDLKLSQSLADRCNISAIVIICRLTVMRAYCDETMTLIDCKCSKL